jgi:hypothetical protein
MNIVSSFIKTILLSLLILIAFACNAQSKRYDSPPLGWNSYNAFGYSVHEKDVQENADYMAKHLKQFGWEYIVIDFLWFLPPIEMPNPYTPDISYMHLDNYGRGIPDTIKFPSAKNGFKPLADYIHSKGLKFGIHVMRGMPRQAYYAKSPIKGTNGITVDMITDTNSVCDWLGYIWGIDMTKPGSQEYLNSLFELYAEWGVDFVKVDNILDPVYQKAEIEGYRKAIENCGRPIFLSLSHGDAPREEIKHLQKYANSWRVTADYADTWISLHDWISVYAPMWQGLHGKTGWADLDIMHIGMEFIRRDHKTPHYNDFNSAELYSQMTLWCIFKSPLMVGAHLPENRPIDDELLTNSDLIEINQKGLDPREAFRSDSSYVWTSRMPNGDWNIAVFNGSVENKTVALNFESLGLEGRTGFSLRDLWKKTDEGSHQDNYVAHIEPHGVVLLRAQKLPPAVSEIEILPNPAVENIDINLPEGQTNPNLIPVVAELRNMQGQLVLRRSIEGPGKITRLDITNLPAGNYVLQLSGRSYKKRKTISIIGR